MLNQQITSDYTSPFTASSHDGPIISNHSMINQAPKDPTPLNLRALRHKKKSADKVIEILQVRINYLQNKQEEEARRSQSTKRRSQDFQRKRRIDKQQKQLQQDLKRRNQEQIHTKIRSNSQLRSNIHRNKSLINSMLEANKQKQIDCLKKKNKKLKQEYQLNSQTSRLQLVQKVKQSKESKLSSNYKLELHHHNKMMNLKGVKERRLNLELKIKNRNQSKLSELKQTQAKLQKMAIFSEKYRHQCESEYYSSRLKYQEFRNTRRQKEREAAGSRSSVESDTSGIFLS